MIQLPPDPDLIPTFVNGVLVPMDKLTVHRKGLRHLAVSVFVCDGSAMLIQQRAQAKYHSPGLWANTCCTHPYWGEPADACAHRRLEQELGLTVMPLLRSGQIEYRADVGNGLIEHELVEVFVARIDARPDVRPDPAEAAATRWISFADLTRDMAARPGDFTPWLHIYLNQHRDRIFGTSRELSGP